MDRQNTMTKGLSQAATSPIVKHRPQYHQSGHAPAIHLQHRTGIANAMTPHMPRCVIVTAVIESFLGIELALFSVCTSPISAPVFFLLLTLLTYSKSQVTGTETSVVASPHPFLPSSQQPYPLARSAIASAPSCTSPRHRLDLPQSVLTGGIWLRACHTSFSILRTPLSTQLKILPKQFDRLGAGKAEPEEAVHGALLNLRSGFPAGDGRFANA